MLSMHCILSERCIPEGENTIDKEVLYVMGGGGVDEGVVCGFRVSGVLVLCVRVNALRHIYEKTTIDN